MLFRSDGISRTLFPIIDSGNVVILVYEHQCSSCLVGAKNLKTAINTYFPKETNIRILYLDNGGYSCSSVKSWISSNVLKPGSVFMYSNTQTSPYGSGMPVIVITGTKAHKVYAITNSVNLPGVTTLKNAIQAAQSDITTSIKSDINSGSFNIYPNPAINDKVLLKFNSKVTQLNSYEILNASGQIIIPSKRINFANDQKEISLVGLDNCIYFVFLNTSEGLIVRKLIISK